MGLCWARIDAEREIPMTPRQRRLLKEYGEKLVQYADYDPEELPCLGKLEDELRPLIEGFFDMHDSAGNGTLDEDESMILFHTLVSTASPFDNATCHALMIKVQHAQSDEKSHRLKVLKKAIKLKHQQHKEEYEKHKDEFDEAGFHVIDRNSDGRLRKDDVVEALTPGTALHDDFFEALGFPNVAEHHDLNEIFLKQYAIELQKYAAVCTLRPESELEHTLRPIVESLFYLYDTDGDDAFEIDEARSFFEDLTCSHHTHFRDALAHCQVVRALEEVSELLPSQEHTLHRVIEKQYEKYELNRDECNKVAFDVLDTNHDGQLQLSEIWQALLPGTMKNDEFLEAFHHERIDVQDL